VFSSVDTKNDKTQSWVTKRATKELQRSHSQTGCFFWYIAEEYPVLCTKCINTDLQSPVYYKYSVQYFLTAVYFSINKYDRVRWLEKNENKKLLPRDWASAAHITLEDGPNYRWMQLDNIKWTVLGYSPVKITVTLNDPIPVANGVAVENCLTGVISFEFHTWNKQTCIRQLYNCEKQWKWDKGTCKLIPSFCMYLTE